MSVKADLIAALRAIAIVDSAYRASHGPEFVIDEMKRRAMQALNGEFSGVGTCDCGRKGEVKP